jgi:ribosomal protein S18 acetylase RimI-like enzyme
MPKTKHPMVIPGLDELVYAGNARPYLCAIVNKKIASVLWKDTDNVVSIATLPEFRRKRLATALVQELIDDIFKKKIKGAFAYPMNRASKKLFKNNGFVESIESEGFLEFSLTN